MKRIVLPASHKHKQDLFVYWLEHHDITWAVRQNDGSFTVVSVLKPEIERELVLLLKSLFPGATVTEEDVPKVEKVTVPLTWYQYRTKVRALTGKWITTDIHDTILGFAEADGKFTMGIRRVEYRETKKRDVVTGTKIEIITIHQTENKWVKEIMTLDTELAPDSLKFGTVLNPTEYWHKLQAELPHFVESLTPSEQSTLAYVAKLGKLVK